jgi:sigma-B regulation protein RsbU (phosphoserine phosphatase)
VERKDKMITLTPEKELKIATEISAAVSKSLDLNTVLKVALQHVLKSFAVDVGLIYIFDPKTNMLKMAIETNVTKPFKQQKSIVSLGEGCAGTAAQTKKIFAAFEEPEAKYICADAEALMGIDCLVAAPIIVEDQVIGVLELFAPTARRLTPQEAELLDIINAQIGVAIRNAQIYQAEQETKAKLEKTVNELNLLMNISQTLTSTLNMEEIMATLAERLTRLLLIKRAVVALYDEKAEQLVFSQAVDSAPVGKRMDLSLWLPLIEPCLKGQPLFIHKLENKVAQEIKELFQEYQIKSAAFIPLYSKNKCLGFLILDEPNTDRHFSQDEINLAQTVANQAALVLENAQAFARQKSISISLQKAFIPEQLPYVEGLEFSGTYIPAGEESLVGGDFYDAFVLPSGETFALIGDVSGKGVEAAHVTSLAKTVFRLLGQQNKGLRELVIEANQIICRELGPGDFITGFILTINLATSTLNYINAGHYPPLLLSNNKVKFKELNTYNFPLGVFPDTFFEMKKTTFKRGDMLVLFTDGVVEARNKNELFGLNNLKQELQKNKDQPLEVIKEQLLQAIKNFTNNFLTDDLAFLLIKAV